MMTPRPTLPRRLALVGPVAVAALAVSARHPARAADPGAEAPIVGLNQALIAAMQAGQGTPFAQRFERLAPVVERAFDLPGILQASVGPRWSGLPPAQQARLLEVFRRFTVASYAARFNSYNGERIAVSISCGVAQHHNDAESVEETIRRADAALYASKEHGRNRVSVG